MKLGLGMGPQGAKLSGVKRDTSRFKAFDTLNRKVFGVKGRRAQHINVRSSQPFLIFGGKMPVIHTTWASPDRVVFDIVGDDIDVRYARDRERGIRMNYTLQPAPAGEAPKL